MPPWDIESWKDIVINYLNNIVYEFKEKDIEEENISGYEEIIEEELKVKTVDNDNFISLYMNISKQLEILNNIIVEKDINYQDYLKIINDCNNSIKDIIKFIH